MIVLAQYVSNVVLLCLHKKNAIVNSLFVTSRGCFPNLVLRMDQVNIQTIIPSSAWASNMPCNSVKVTTTNNRCSGYLTETMYNESFATTINYAIRFVCTRDSTSFMMISRVILQTTTFGCVVACAEVCKLEHRSYFTRGYARSLVCKMRLKWSIIDKNRAWHNPNMWN